MLPVVKNGDADKATGKLAATRLEKVIAEHLSIIVRATLQHPSVAISDDSGKIQPFSSRIYSESIDGDVLCGGDKCVVVFQALMMEQECGQGLQQVNKRYVLVASDA